MNARNDVKRPSDQNLDARFVLAAAQRRLAASVDLLVARWLKRYATKIQAPQRLFKDRSEAHTQIGDGREPCLAE